LDSFGVTVFTCGSRVVYNGTIVFDDFRVPFDFFGGEYQVKVSIYSNDIPTSFRKFRVGVYD